MSRTKTTAAMVRRLALSAALAAGMALQPAMAQISVSDNGRGNAVFVPYYTVNAGWSTLVNITNTSPNSVVIKFRLHEARNSRDVLDFNVALSPYDVWTAFVVEENGVPTLRTTDRSCTIPLSVRDDSAPAGPGTPASQLAYSGAFRDHTDTDGDISRMSEGYIEILVMGETSGEGVAPTPGENPRPSPDGTGASGSTAYFAKHVNGEPRDCNIVQNDFVRRTATWVAPSAGNGFALNPIPGDFGSGSPLARLGSLSGAGAPGGGAANVESTVGYHEIMTPDILKVNASLVNQGNGRAAGVESLHIFGWGMDQNLVTAQQFPWFLEPALASADGLWTVTALDPINQGIAATQVMNEWTSNPNTGALADWVVTFPSKRFQADHDARNIQAACSVWRNADTFGGAVNGTAAAMEYEGWPDSPASPRPLFGEECPELGFPNIFQEGNDGRSDLVVEYRIFDREEGEVAFEVDGPIVSPAPPPTVEIDNLPYEVNVLKIGRNAGALPSALDSLISGAVDTSTLPSNANAGWLILNFLGEIEEGVIGPQEYPVTGFIYKQRDFGNPGLNFGQATEHGYTRGGR